MHATSLRRPREFNEKLVSSDITPELATELTLQIEQITTS